MSTSESLPMEDRSKNVAPLCFGHFCCSHVKSSFLSASSSHPVSVLISSRWWYQTVRLTNNNRRLLDRQTDRQTDGQRQTEKPTENARYTDGQTDRWHTDGQTEAGWLYDCFWRLRGIWSHIWTEFIKITSYGVCFVEKRFLRDFITPDIACNDFFWQSFRINSESDKNWLCASPRWHYSILFSL